MLLRPWHPINRPAIALRLCSSSGPSCSISNRSATYATIAVNANQLAVERGIVHLGQGDAVGDDRLAEKLVASAMMWAASSR